MAEESTIDSLKKREKQIGQKAFIAGVAASFFAGLIVWFLQASTSSNNAKQ